MLVAMTTAPHWRWQNLFNLCDSDGWEEFDEQSHPHPEPTECAYSYANLNPRKVIPTPRSWNELSGQRLEDNIKPLQPHSYVDEDGQDKQERDIRSQRFNPQQLRKNTVTERHTPKGYPELTERPEPELKTLKRIITKPRGIELGDVGVGNNP
jgi:hypothetical protein